MTNRSVLRQRQGKVPQYVNVRLSKLRPTLSLVHIKHIHVALTKVMRKLPGDRHVTDMDCNMMTYCHKPYLVEPCTVVSSVDGPTESLLLCGCICRGDKTISILKTQCGLQ